MRRREFITLLGSAAAAFPLAARAQQSAKQPVIGFLGPSTPTATSQSVAAFVQRLRDLGWIDGRTVTIEYRWAEGRSSRARRDRGRVRSVESRCHCHLQYVISPRAKQATSVIPIVFAAASDPVGAGLVARLARPEGNVTGLSSQQIDNAGKRLELLREVVPGLRRLAILANVGNPAAALEMGEAKVAARSIGLEVTTIEIWRGEDIAPGFEALMGKAEALYVCTDPLVLTNRVRIQTSAMGARLPTVYNSREYVETGGLMSYGPNFLDQWRRTAEMSTRFCAGQSLATSRSNSRPSSNWSSI